MTRLNAAQALSNAFVLLLCLLLWSSRQGRVDHKITAAGLPGRSPAAVGVRVVEMSPRSMTTRRVAPSRHPHPSLNWQALALCESSGNWQDTAGYYQGGLQFAPTTWASFHGTDFAPRADLATRWQQIRVAERVLRRQGLAAWPACTLKLGWR